MNILDIVFLLVLSFLLIRGFFNGIIQEIASIASFILAFVLASNYYGLFESFFRSFSGLEEAWAMILAYAVCFFVVMLVVFVLAHILKKFLRLTAFGWLDTLGGGGVGFFKGAFLCAIFLFILTVFLPRDTSLLRESKISPYIARFSSVLASYVPKAMQQNFENNSQRIQQKWYERFLGQFVNSFTQKETTQGKQ